MKRSLIVLCAAALLATIPLARVAVAAKPVKEAKVLICHVNNSANGVFEFRGGYVAVLGRVIEVPASAVAAHEAHGDSTSFFDMTKKDRDFFEMFGVSSPNANAWFIVYP